MAWPTRGRAPTAGGGGRRTPRGRAGAGCAMAERTIMVVEDDPVTQQAVSDILRKGGYAVLTADDGEQALAALSSSPVDLVLLDMLLPKLDGWAFLKSPRPPVPVVVTTGIDLTLEWAEAHGCQG